MTINDLNLSITAMSSSSQSLNISEGSVLLLQHRLEKLLGGGEGEARVHVSRNIFLENLLRCNIIIQQQKNSKGRQIKDIFGRAKEVPPPQKPKRIRPPLMREHVCDQPPPNPMRMRVKHHLSNSVTHELHGR